MKEILLFSAAGLFIVLMLFRLVRGLLLGRSLAGKGDEESAALQPEFQKLIDSANSPTKAREILRDIERKAAQKREFERANYYTASGDIALSALKRPNVAVGLYLRALRNNPACEPALDRLTSVLLAQKNFKRFERTCWTLLSKLGDDATGTTMWIKCWTGLANVYSMSPRLSERADAIRKMLNNLCACDSFAEDESTADRDA